MVFSVHILKFLAALAVAVILSSAATYAYFTYATPLKTATETVVNTITMTTYGTVTETRVVTTTVAQPITMTFYQPTMSTYAVPQKTVTLVETLATTIITPITVTTTIGVTATVGKFEVKYPITIVDSAGRTVTFEDVPKRVVVVSSTHAMVLLALGVGDKIVGATDTVTKNPLLMSLLPNKNIVEIGKWSSPSAEAIMLANSDLVIFYASFYRSTYDAVASKLPQNVKVVYFDLYKPSTMFDEIYKLGLIFNRVDKALEIISKWSSRLTSIAAKAAEIRPSDRVRVFFETYTELATAGPGSGWYQVLTFAGGINVFGDVQQPYPKVSPEAVIERNPDVIIKVVSSTTFDPCRANTTKTLENIYNTIVSRPGWDKISAVANKRVYIYSTAYLDGPGYVIQVAITAKLLYPQTFRDIDVQKWIYEWLADMGLNNPEKVCGMPWVYPEIP
ncbi:ABC transporter substrate-binding protein [Ignisphaera sp. 4213-co]|uniref:ABC transporter substrate-binding protein n=1 Tax=Ignisphaera cupida TaxID=3050454 RepID=A0ABD4Z6G8_9CREN|nr:ABC transporter substrate-binding protein [Ignisphaera sp. 4213-co]MDK6028921.1 ABC transporter substrate-binding protein [Ignisphaera sp. 4213-co]